MTMKAAVVEKYGTITICDLPEPTMGDYTALCELLYGATCTGTDTHLVEGHAPFTSWVKLPFILGHESVGRVVKLGSKVRNFKIGDLVTRVGAPAENGMNVGWGGFAEMGLAYDHWAMAADGLPSSAWTWNRVNQIVPSGIDPKVAPMFITWRETLSALLRLGVTAGNSLLVAGSGGNGLAFAVQARNLGASCVAMVGSSRVAVKAPVDCYLDYNKPDYTEVLKQAQTDGFDFIIDSVGKAGMADCLLPSLKAGGRYMTYGLDDCGAITFNASLARGAFTVMPCSYDESETHKLVCDAILTGKLDASLWYDTAAPYPLTQINEAFAAVRNRKNIKSLVFLRK